MDTGKKGDLLIILKYLEYNGLTSKVGNRVKISIVKTSKQGKQGGKTICLKHTIIKQIKSNVMWNNWPKFIWHLKLLPGNKTPDRRTDILYSYNLANMIGKSSTRESNGNPEDTELGLCGLRR